MKLPPLVAGAGGPACEPEGLGKAPEPDTWGEPLGPLDIFLSSVPTAPTLLEDRVLSCEPTLSLPRLLRDCLARGPVEVRPSCSLDLRSCRR